MLTAAQEEMTSGGARRVACPAIWLQILTSWSLHLQIMMLRRKANMVNDRNRRKQKARRPEHQMEQKMKCHQIKNQSAKVHDRETVISHNICKKGINILFNLKLNISQHVTLPPKKKLI